MIVKDIIENYQQQDHENDLSYADKKYKFNEYLLDNKDRISEPYLILSILFFLLHKKKIRFNKKY
jgi:hypothetical protein